MSILLALAFLAFLVWYFGRDAAAPHLLEPARQRAHRVTRRAGHRH
jgi:hypothetical protein